MSLTVRGILVVIIGTVLGLTVSIGGEFLSGVEARRLAEQKTVDPAIVLADVIARVQEEYVDTIDSQVLIESAIRGIVRRAGRTLSVPGFARLRGYSHHGNRPLRRRRPGRCVARWQSNRCDGNRRCAGSACRNSIRRRRSRRRWHDSNA